MKSLASSFAIIAAAVLIASAVPAAAQSYAFNQPLSPISGNITHQHAEDAAQIQAVLAAFDTALFTRDVDQLEAAGISSSSAKGWRKFFRSNPRATVTDSCSTSDLSITGDSASWSCVETATVISEGRPQPFVQSIRFTYERRNGSWLIADRR